MSIKKIFQDIFGTPAHKLVRKDDPITSHEAAQKVDTTKLEKMVYEAIASFGEQGCISDDILNMFNGTGQFSTSDGSGGTGGKGRSELVPFDNQMQQIEKNYRSTTLQPTWF